MQTDTIAINRFGTLARGTMLVAGTSIGGGMLALPVLTSQVGFVPSLFVYIGCWLFMTFTGLLFLEISMWLDPDANIVTMAERLLGGWGKAFAWGLYLFLFYCLTLAYIVGVGDLILEVMEGSIALTSWQAQMLFVLLFGPLVFAGARVVGRINFILMIGLGISYVAFLIVGSSYVRVDLLKTADWTKLWSALPITFTAFAYQGVIPTLVTYMHRNIPLIRMAIIIGSFLPLITYALWQWLILGIVPVEGANSLATALENGQNAVQPLKDVLNIPTVYIIGRYFAFFALVTSFLGVSLALLDFLADGLKVKKTEAGKFALCMLIFVPPLLFAFTHPHVFLIALDYAGGFGCALLLGLLPVLMVWSGRYKMGLKGEYTVWGGRGLLVALSAFVVLELICQFMLIR